MSIMGRKRPRILIADDHTLVAEAYRGILEPENEVIGTVADGRALVERASALFPELIILDLAMPLLNGLDAILQIRHKLPNIKIVVVTMNKDPQLIAEAFRRGASGYIPKTSAPPELLQAVHEVLNGRSYLSPSAAKETIGSLIRQEPTESDPLTDRQREVIQLLAEGKSMKETAALMNTTIRTVSFHKYRVMKKLRLSSSAELVQYAMRNHIIGA
jgi:DNA-binding NarL/FixJ family response regulator